MNETRPILDACCGGRMWWFDKNDDRSIRETSQEITTHFSFDLDQTGWRLTLSKTVEKERE